MESRSYVLVNSLDEHAYNLILQQGHCELELLGGELELQIPTNGRFIRVQALWQDRVLGIVFFVAVAPELRWRGDFEIFKFIDFEWITATTHLQKAACSQVLKFPLSTPCTPEIARILRMTSRGGTTRAESGREAIAIELATADCYTYGLSDE